MEQQNDSRPKLAWHILAVLSLFVAACDDQPAEKASPPEVVDPLRASILANPESLDEETYFAWGVTLEQVQRCLDVLPTGDPGNPFCISVIEGDGWRMYDAGPGLHNNRGEAVWINNRQLVFIARNYQRAKYNNYAQAEGPAWLWLWDIDKGSEGITKFREQPLGPGAGGLCYSGRHLRAVLERDSERTVVLTGPPDDLRVEIEPRKKGRQFPPAQMLNQFECRWQPTPRITEPYQPVVPLREGDGFLEGSPFNLSLEEKQNRQAKLINMAQGVAAAMPFSEGYTSFQCLRYAPFKQAYFTWSCSMNNNGKDFRGYAEQDCVDGYWFRGDGWHETVCMTTEVYGHGSQSYYVPTATGFVIFAIGGRHGVYLAREGKVERILIGHSFFSNRYPANETALSPDGCRLAFMTEPRFSGSDFTGPQITWRILDLCPGQTDIQN